MDKAQGEGSYAWPKTAFFTAWTKTTRIYHTPSLLARKCTLSLLSHLSTFAGLYETKNIISAGRSSQSGMFILCSNDDNLI